MAPIRISINIGIIDPNKRNVGARKIANNIVPNVIIYPLIWWDVRGSNPGHSD